MAEVKFYLCEECGNVVELIHNGEGTLVCCGQDMKLLEAGVTDAAVEKHVPAITREGNQVNVQVGSVPHPMIEAHYIVFIALVQGDKVQRVNLHPGEEPKASFVVDDGPVTVYEFCNLHGLWKAEA